VKCSFKVVRSQLGQYNPYYTPVSKDEEDAAEENEGWEPLDNRKHGNYTDTGATLDLGLELRLLYHVASRVVSNDIKY
jgi:hypothetical protein